MGYRRRHGVSLRRFRSRSFRQHPTQQNNPAPVWAEEFDTLDLVTSANTAGRWRPNDVWQNINSGYQDFSGNSWNLNPNQNLAGAPRAAWSIANSILTITSQRTPSAWEADIVAANGGNPAPPWCGGILITNTSQAVNRFGYGYYAIRARWPTAGRGMFPALWFFAANGQNIGKERAEIDLLEIFGHSSGQPWSATLHQKKDPDGSPATGATTGDGQVAVGTFNTDTAAWHVYGLDWTANYLRFYKDDVMVAEITGANATFFNGVTMSIRLNYSMDAGWFPTGQKSDGTTPSSLTMEVDYIRAWASKPSGSGSASSTPKMESLVINDWTTEQSLFTNYDALRRTSGSTLQIDAAASYPAVTSVSSYDLTSSYYQVELVSPPQVSNGSTEALIVASVSSSDSLAIGWTNNAIFARRRVGGVNTDSGYTTYSATNHRFLRIRENSGSIYYETSANGSSWANIIAPIATPFAVTSVKANLIAGNWNAASNPGYATFQKINSL